MPIRRSGSRAATRPDGSRSTVHSSPFLTQPGRSGDGRSRWLWRVTTRSPTPTVRSDGSAQLRGDLAGGDSMVAGACVEVR